MQRNLTLPFFLITCYFWSLSYSLYAQNIPVLDQPRAKKPHAVVLAGLSSSISVSTNSTVPYALIGAEYAVSRFLFLGMQYNHLILPIDPGYDSDQSLYEYQKNNYGNPNARFTGGYEVSLYSKYFFHARFSDRRSRYFVGIEGRKGVYQLTTNDLFKTDPNPPLYYKSVEIPVKHQITKIMLNLGIQLRGKVMVFEFNFPVGIMVENPEERNTSGLIVSHAYAPATMMALVFIPGFKIGFII